MRNEFIMRLFCLALLASGGAACGKKQTTAEIPPGARLETFKYNPGSRLEERIGAMPAALLEEYRLLDGRPEYKAYDPSPEEKALLLNYLRLMPPSVERLFREKCVGLFFVEGFKGNGITSWVVDGGGRTYFHISFNPAAFRQTLSETLTERERSCFIPAKDWKLSIEAGSEYKGLAYAVFHEAAHAVDYMKGLTPLLDPDMPEAYRPAVRPDGGLFSEVWTSRAEPSSGNDYPGRDKLAFYGLNGGARIYLPDAPGVYKGLAASPFVSLYGSLSWAEDFAELTAYALIVSALGQPYKISVSGPGGDFAGEPMAGRAGRRAEAALKLLERI